MTKSRAGQPLLITVGEALFSYICTIMKRILIIPDVHGRKFWRDAVKEAPLVDHTVFLGDYLDPYPLENISPELAYNNFLDILEFKKSDPKHITLLLGNHDCHYRFYDDFESWGRGSRFNWKDAAKYRKTFEENARLFDLAWQVELKGTHYLFTHAGITKAWLEQNELKLPKDRKKIANWLNSFEGDHKRILCLGDVGRSRGGMCGSGSPVWADREDHYTTETFTSMGEDLYQVFGHTLEKFNCMAGEHVACLDCKRAFIMTGAGVFGELPSKEGEEYWKFKMRVAGLPPKEALDEWFKYLGGGGLLF